ncbi:MAG TPA: ABC transporter substrate-binding protein, partial [Nocardioidaceae bacterium]
HKHDEEMPVRDVVLRVACLVLVALLGACTGSGVQDNPTAQPGTAARDGSEITVGSFDFPESVLLAHIYASALAAEGFPVRVLPDLGSRELVEPALMNDLIQLVPEYTGSASDFLSLGRLPSSSDAEATYQALARSAQRRGLVAAQPAPAQDANAVVVTAATAARYHLRSIDDLVDVAPELVFGGPPECPKRPQCLPGLERTYGLHFKAFAPTDAGGPLTRQALISGQIGVGLLFTTDPSIAARGLVILTDNRALQPAENVTPLVHRETVARYGRRLIAALDAVSARLSTRTLRDLNAHVQLGGMTPRSVARDWLRSESLIPNGQVPR